MISQSTSLDLDPASRYKDTPLLVDPSGNVFFGLYVVPVELTPPAQVAGGRLSGAEVPFLDILANRHYGVGSELQWWAISIVNGIIDCDRDVLAGVTLQVPDATVLSAISARAGLNNG